MEKQIPITYTVTMDARLAQIVGIPAAMLYNLLVWQSETDMAKDYDENGWFYFTAQRFAKKTTFNQNTFTNSIKKLEEIGLIEKKRAYIKYGFTNSNRSANHFRIKLSLEEFLLTRNVSNTHTGCDLYIKEEKNKEKSQFTQSDELGSSSKSFEDSSPKESETSSNNSVPFGEPVKDMPTRSLRPDKEKKAADAQRRADYAMLGEIRKHFGFTKGSGTPEEKKLLRARLDEGWTKDEIIKVITWIKENREWYKDKPIQVCLASKVFDEYQASDKSSYRFNGESGTQVFDRPGDVSGGEDGFLPINIPGRIY